MKNLTLISSILLISSVLFFQLQLGVSTRLLYGNQAEGDTQENSDGNKTNKQQKQEQNQNPQAFSNPAQSQNVNFINNGNLLSTNYTAQQIIPVNNLSNQSEPLQLDNTNEYAGNNFINQIPVQQNYSVQQAKNEEKATTDNTNTATNLVQRRAVQNRQPVNRATSARNATPVRRNSPSVNSGTRRAGTPTVRRSSKSLINKEKVNKTAKKKKSYKEAATPARVLKPGKTVEVLVEKYKKIKKVTLCDGKYERLYCKVEHGWGAIFYFKDNSSISQTSFFLETGGEV